MTTSEVITPIANEDTVEQAVLKQFREEAGADPLPGVATEAFLQRQKSKKTTQIENENAMLQQKYGIVPPVLTLSELNLIRREERNAARR